MDSLKEFFDENINLNHSGKISFPVIPPKNPVISYITKEDIHPIIVKPPKGLHKMHLDYINNKGDDK